MVSPGPLYPPRFLSMVPHAVQPRNGSGMWRLQGLLSRALHRLHVLNASSSVHGIPTLPGNEELRNTTSALSAGQTPTEQSRQSWEEENVQQSLDLQAHYTVLDAFTWGALTVLALQLARQIPWLSHVPGAGREGRHPWVGRLLPSVLPHQYSAPAAGSCTCHNNQRVPCFMVKGIPDTASGNPSPGIPSGKGEYQMCPETEECPFPESWSTSLEPAHCSAQGLSFSTLQGKSARQGCQVFRVSVSIALNILGLESVSDGHYVAAYSYFKLAADRGYSKAQFNVALCYEHGRGTEKDLAKAALYYHRAASNEHPMAQYRYAKFLLRHGLQTKGADVQKAVALLEKAAGTGLVEAQAYLGVLYMKEPQAVTQKALKYLWLAAKNGDSQSRYHVGVCYEKGLGVQRNFAEAMEHYQHSAAAGNRHAQERVRFVDQEMAATKSCRPAPSRMRAFSSSPCLWALEGQHQASPVERRTLALPHSWSTGSLGGADIRGLRWSPAPEHTASLLDSSHLEPWPGLCSQGLWCRR
uniref:DAP3 binding cell death enhancer 1 n=1 Tax=Pelodiscus sinensis TaxID=13735 RepID=K7FGD6_PELSI